jgi:hypothetical protein
MRVRSTIVAGALAASALASGSGCSSTTTGADLRIDATNATRVEVFVATSFCEDADGAPCASGIGWDANVTKPPPGHVYLLPDDRRLEAVAHAGEFAVQLQAEPRGRFRKPLAIAIAGYGPSGDVIEAAVLRGVEIPLDTIVTWRVKLEPVAHASEDIDAEPTTRGLYVRAHAWRAPGDEAAPSCLAYQQWYGSEWKTEYFVPPGDPDCDGLTPDCTPYWAHREDNTTTPYLCVGSTGPLVPGSCMVGRSTCADMQAGFCEQGLSGAQICVPDYACTRCSGRPLLACVGEDLSDTSVPRVACMFDRATDQWCSSVGIVVMPGLGSRCIGAKLRARANPFAGGLASQSISPGVDVVIAAVEPAGGSGCSIRFMIDGSSNLADASHEAILAVSYENGRELVLPVMLGFQGSTVCSSEVPCALLGDRDDSMFACTAPIAP